MANDNNTTLDVEDDDDRQNRIRALLEKLNSGPGTQPLPEFPKFDLGDRSTFAVNPPSELLSRVQAFLPQLQASNDVLVQRMQDDPNSLNIEHISEHVDQYIEMDLGLGVFEDRSHKKAREDQDTEMSSSSSSSSSSSEELDQDDSNVESDASSEIITSFVPVRPIKPLPRRSLNRARPQITVLEEKSQE